MRYQKLQNYNYNIHMNTIKSVAFSTFTERYFCLKHKVKAV